MIGRVWRVTGSRANSAVAASIELAFEPLVSASTSFWSLASGGRNGL
jgi:hypothetical protein